MESSKTEQLQADLDEMKLLAQTAKRPNVQSILLKAMNDLTLQIDHVTSLTKELSLDKSASPTVPSSMTPTPREFITISSFAWDQKDHTVNIYISLAGIHKIPSENVVTNFGNNFFDLKVLDCGRRNYRLYVNPCCGTIKPKGCTCRVKTDSLVVKLEKADRKNWDSLEVKEAQKKTKKDEVDDFNPDDPTGNLMGMMRKLYQEGDDEMKKIIAKTWSDAQENRLTGKEF